MSQQDRQGVPPLHYQHQPPRDYHQQDYYQQQYQHRPPPTYHPPPPPIQHQEPQQNTFGTNQRLYPATAVPPILLAGDRHRKYPEVIQSTYPNPGKPQHPHPQSNPAAGLNSAHSYQRDDPNLQHHRSTLSHSSRTHREDIQLQQHHPYYDQHHDPHHPYHLQLQQVVHAQPTSHAQPPYYTHERLQNQHHSSSHHHQYNEYQTQYKTNYQRDILSQPEIIQQHLRQGNTPRMQFHPQYSYDIHQSTQVPNQPQQFQHPQQPILSHPVDQKLTKTPQDINAFSTLPSGRPVPAPRKAGQRPLIKRQNSFSGFPTSLELSQQPSANSTRSAVITNLGKPLQVSLASKPLCQNLSNASSVSSTTSGHNTLASSIETSNDASDIGRGVIKDGVPNYKQSDLTISSLPLQPRRTTSLSQPAAENNNGANRLPNNNINEASGGEQHSHVVINVRNDLTKTNCTLAPSSGNNVFSANKTEQLTVVSTVTSHYANAIQSLRNNNINSSNGNSDNTSVAPKPDLVTSNKVQSTHSSNTSATTTNTTAKIDTKPPIPPATTSTFKHSPTSDVQTSTLTAITSTTSTSPTKKELRTAPGMFYSLPRHATASSNPSLMRASASGLGLYLMSRKDTKSATSESAAKQLGVSIPTGANKFRSLPRPSKSIVAVPKSQGYLSLPRPSKVLTSIAMLSLPPNDKPATSTSGPTKSSTGNYSKKVHKDHREGGEGKENIDAKMVRRHTEQASSKSIYKDIDLKYQSLPRKKDLELKHLSLPKKIPKELKDIDAKYQSLPKKKSKELEQKYQSLPKRNGREGETRHSANSRRNKDSESRHSSSKRSSSREPDNKSSKREIRSPPGYNKPRRSSDGPRSPRWIPTDSDEDDVYSSIKSRDDSSHNSSVPETPYSKPLPPLPAPSRYRRRMADKDSSSPPLPPPRISTAPKNLQQSQQSATVTQPIDFNHGVPVLEMRSLASDQNQHSHSAIVTAPSAIQFDYTNDSGYHPPPPRIPPPKSGTKAPDVYLSKSGHIAVCKASLVRESPQGGVYPPPMTSIDHMRTTSHKNMSGGYPHPGSALTLPHPGTHGYRNMPSNQSVLENLPPGATYPRNHQAARLYYVQDIQRNSTGSQYPQGQSGRAVITTVHAPLNTYKLHYLDMVQSDSARHSQHSGLPASAIPLPGLSASFTPGGFASSRAMFTGIPRDSVSGIPPPLDPPPKIPHSEPDQRSSANSATTHRPESPLYASDPLYETPQIPHVPGGVPVYPQQQIQSQKAESARRYQTNRTPSPDNLLTRTEPSGEEDHYSSIPSLLSTTPETPSVIPRSSWSNKVTNSSSWDSIGSSGFSSMGSSQGLSANTSSSRESAAARKRRRARSDPRMDAAVLQRLGFSACSSAITFEKENQLEGGDAVKQPLVSSRNTQSAARLNRIINVSFGPSYKNGSSSTLPHTRTLPCGLQTSTLRGTQDTAPTHGRGGSLREELMPRYGGHHHQQQRMDLVYVTERIISLAFPPDLDDTSYTVHLRDVAHMLSSKHGDNFRVFNLSSCVGEVSHYLPRVTELGWPPLLAPALEKLCAICKALESWLSVNSQHVAVLHDREGYEKLGVVVAAYMHYTNICASTDTALDRYAMKRFFDDKIGQLYHPSQKRYVQYFSGLLSGIIRINSSPLYLHTLTLYGVPHFEPRGGCHLFIKVYQGMTHIYTSGVYQITDGLRHVTIVLQNQRQQSGSHQNNTRITGIQLRGDVLLKAYHRRLTPQPSREIVFRAQFHTCAVSEKVLGFSRLDLDDACNDLRFPLDGGIELCFSQGGDDPPRAVSNVSCDKSPCPITAWDSMEALHTRRSDSTGPNAHSESVAHTLGPIDGSLYATVNKRKNTDVKSTSQQQSLQQQFHHLQHQQQDHRLQQHLQDQQHLQQYQRESSKGNITPYNSHIQQHHTPHRNLQYPHSTPHTPQHPLTSTQHHGHHSASSTISSSNHQLSSQHQQQQQHHLNQHHHHHHLHNQSTQQQSSNQHRHQQYQNSLQSSSSHTHHQTLSTPSPQSTAYINGRYAASIDSGFASTLTPLSPPTSDCPASSASPAARTSGITGNSQTQQHSSRDDQQTHHHIRRFSDPNQLNNMAPVAAVAARPMQGGSNNLNSSRVDARQLDELLAGMLLDIENIPDLRPGQAPAPDIDSIRCPDLSWSSSRGRSSSSRSAGGGHTTLSPVNGYGGSHHQQDSLLDTSISLSNAEDNGTPYHTRMDSRPFSYGAVTSSPVMPRRRSPSSPSTSPTRRSSREPMINRSGLESPRLVRKMSGSVGAVSSSISDIPAPISSGGGINSGILGNDPNDMRSDRPSMSGGGMHSSRRSPSPSPEPGSRGSTLRRERSQTLTNRIMAGDPSPPPTLTRSHVTRSASRLDDPDTIFSPDTLSRSLSGTSSSWLATQQRKLIERREAGRRADRGRNEARVMSELRHRIGQLNKANTNTLPSTFSSRYGRYGDFEDGYVSDTTLFSDTSRESSPMKYNHQYIPLSISTSQNNHSNTINSSYYTNSRRHGGNSYNSHQQNSSSNASAPPSPNVASKTATLNFARDRLQRLSQHYANTTKTLTRKYSDASYDRERPFVTVKRAFNVDKGESALSQLQSAPHGHINYYPSSSPSDGLLTTMHQQSGDELNWQSDPEGHHSVHRPHTPGFPPSTPTTPYLNQGLPPKSPTMQRRAHLGLSSLNQRPPSAGSTSSTLSKEPMVTSTSSAAPNYRSPSPHGLNNGHTSPAPSLYHGPSRRSSLSSLNDSGQEVIHSHPKFVKDISKYWYKPTISRDEAINILKTKPPGTFIVRDSNSFPGAFGLAVKVAIPPPNVKASTTGGDMSNELVRHFLIEPTARGVRLKGCSNEPVFGSLSALVYQHSITALALPCRLTLPEKDPAGPSTPSTPSNGTATVDNNALLHQGAACTVLYLHSMDMESLTGPQAVRRAVSSLLEYSGKGTPTPVHFKVSSAGITLTDNHRTLFFRQHYPVNSISHCGLDPDDRRWQHNSTETGEPLASLRMFGFVAKKGATRAQNQCHILAELEPEQPATAICNFVTKVMMTSANRSNLV